MKKKRIHDAFTLLREAVRYPGIGNNLSWRAKAEDVIRDYPEHTCRYPKCRHYPEEIFTLSRNEEEVYACWKHIGVYIDKGYNFDKKRYPGFYKMAKARQRANKKEQR